MNPTALKLCSNGGMKLDAYGLAVGCCDPCDMSIDRERERIQSLPGLAFFAEYEEGILLVGNGMDATISETEYHARHVFAYTYFNADDGWNVDALEYFDCENCERTVLYSIYDGFQLHPYRFFELPDVCKGCIIKLKDPTLITTIDEGGPHEPTGPFVARSIYTYTNSSQDILLIFYSEGGDETPENRPIDNYAQLLKSGNIPTHEEDIESVLLYPNESVTLWSINESNNDVYNPWEIHCRLYAAKVTCDPCEVAIYNAMYDSGDNVERRYGAGFCTAGGANVACMAAYLVNDFEHLILYGFICDTCEKVQLWDGYEWESPTIPYTEDETACDGEEEVQ